MAALLLIGSAAAAAAAAGAAYAAAETGDAATFWVYHDGVFRWPGDYSFVAVPDYKDVSGGPQHGKYDIKVTVTSPWGGWQPYAANWKFDTSPYNFLRFSLKPTVANQSAQVYFMRVGDKPVGTGVNPFKYGPAPVVGQWNVYTIPLADIGVAHTQIYKFAIQDKTGLATNVFYVDDVAFLADGGRP